MILKILNDLSFLRLPKGRAELVRNIPANILIDYAHNEHAFETILSSIKKYFDNLVVVYGCGGDRDRGKRSQMGAIADELADRLVLTSDNPRTEDPQQILRDVLVGISKDAEIIVEIDR